MQKIQSSPNNCDKKQRRLVPPAVVEHVPQSLYVELNPQRNSKLTGETFKR
jgi:hypothetical protein